MESGGARRRGGSGREEEAARSMAEQSGGTEVEGRDLPGSGEAGRLLAAGGGTEEMWAGG